MLLFIVFYESSFGKKESYSDAAVDLAQELIAKNLDLVYGGRSIGLMGLAPQTLYHAGGNVIGCSSCRRKCNWIGSFLLLRLSKLSNQLYPSLMWRQQKREVILRATSTGKPVLTSPFRLLDSHHLGVVLSSPVYKYRLPSNPTVEERTDATVGYLGGPFDVESLVEKLLGQLAGHEEILVYVYDITNSSDPLIMYGNQNQEGDMSLLHESKLEFGDPFRKHHMNKGTYL